jgi:hypothetical protein
MSFLWKLMPVFVRAKIHFEHESLWTLRTFEFHVVRVGLDVPQEVKFENIGFLTNRANVMVNIDFVDGLVSVKVEF